MAPPPTRAATVIAAEVRAVPCSAPNSPAVSSTRSTVLLYPSLKLPFPLTASQVPLTVPAASATGAERISQAPAQNLLLLAIAIPPVEFRSRLADRAFARDPYQQP